MKSAVQLDWLEDKVNQTRRWNKWRRNYMRKVRSLKKQNPEGWLETQQVGVLLTKARARAREKGWKFSLEKDDVKIPKTCPVLGTKIICGTQKDKGNSPSLDRKDNEPRYESDNTRVISFRANRLKSDATVAEILCLLRYMVGP